LTVPTVASGEQPGAGAEMFIARARFSRILPITFGGAQSMTKREHEVVGGETLPKPAGPYSPGVIYRQLLFVSGQGATDPATGKLAGVDIESQTEQVLTNIRNILEAAGSRMDCVLRCRVFLVDMRDFPAMNAVYGRVFGGHRPARTTVGVTALPTQGLRVEIDAVAYVPGGQ
jgi:2-iminobutanoate/2-iminopropanoate deaminase